MIGYAFCGSFCTLNRSYAVLEQLVGSGYEVQPIMSENVYRTDNRFTNAAEFRERVESLCKRKVIHDIVGAEPLGPKIQLDALVISPCTGNTLAKIASGITDTAVTMAAKAHMRSDRCLLIALASNDLLSANLKNIGTLITRRQVYFVPLHQDDPKSKPHSLVCEFESIAECLELALAGKQKRPLFT